MSSQLVDENYQENILNDKQRNEIERKVREVFKNFSSLANILDDAVYALNKLEQSQK